MKFNSTIDKLGLIQDCETILGMADGGISGDATLLKTFTRLMNVWYRIANIWIWKNQTDWEYDVKELFYILVNKQKTKEELNLFKKLLKEKDIELYNLIEQEIIKQATAPINSEGVSPE